MGSGEPALDSRAGSPPVSHPHKWITVWFVDACLCRSGVCIALLSPGTQEGRRFTELEYIAGSTVVVSFALVSIFAFTSRIPAIERMFEYSFADDQRTRSFPYVLDLAKEHFLLGTGVGTFEQAYRTIEPVELLQRAYFNHAHNDWIQIVIEGGIAAGLILTAAIVAVALRGKAVLAHSANPEIDTRLNWLGLCIIALVALHSFFDYPLRTPSLMLLGAIALGMWGQSFSKPVLQRRREYSKAHDERRPLGRTYSDEA